MIDNVIIFNATFAQWGDGKVGLFQWAQWGGNYHFREIWSMGEMGGSLKVGGDKHPLHTMSNFLCKEYAFDLDYFDIFLYIAFTLLGKIKMYTRQI